MSLQGATSHDMNDNRLKRKLFNYKAFGLTICSQMEFPELCPSSSAAEVYVKIIDDTDSPQAYDNSRSFSKVTPQSFVLNVEKVGHFTVTHGNTISIKPAQQANNGELRLYTLGTCFGVLLHQRNITPIHGSAIVTPKGAILFSAESGRGKSSLIAVLAIKGFKVLSDDVCSITHNENCVILHPSYPQIKLHFDTLKHLNIPSENLIKDPETKKAYYPVRGQYSAEEIKLKSIIFIRTTDTKNYVSTELQGQQKFLNIVKNTYRANYLPGLGKQTIHFQNCTNIAKMVPMFELERPNHPFDLEHFSNYIIKMFCQ